MRRGTELRCSVEGAPEPRDESVIEREERWRLHLERWPGVDYVNIQLAMREER